MSLAVLARKTAAAATATKAPAKSSPGSLRIGEVDDSYEQEADRIADEIMAGRARPVYALSGMNIAPPLQRKCACGGKGECDECKKKGTLQRKASGPDVASHAPPIVHEVLNSPGRPLDNSTRSFFEPRFGHDFSRVRIHADAKAAESARAVSALAYTVGQDLVFDSGRYAPDTAEGRRLLAHELTHVLQQSGDLPVSRLQRDVPDPKKNNPPGQAPQRACIKGVGDGTGSVVEPAMKAYGRTYTFAIFAEPVQGDTLASIRSRVIPIWIDSAYPKLTSQQRTNAIHALDPDRLIPVGDPVPGCAYIIWLDTILMQRLEVATGEAARKRKEGGKAAEKREKSAGLPTKEEVDKAKQEDKAEAKDEKKDEAPTVAGKSGSEYTGPSDKKGNRSALPASVSGPDTQPENSIGTYKMELVYAWAGSDTLSQVAEAMNWVNYHWERFDITPLVVKGLTEKQKEKLKQQKPSDEAEVSHMAAAGRRAEFAFDDLKEDSANSLDDLLHPVSSSSTGSPGDIAKNTIANYENLVLLPASAIVAVGGWALGALADLLGGTFQEREIPFPDRPGYFLIRCIAQPDAQGPNGDSQRVASVAVKTVEVRGIRNLAKNALLTPQADIADKKLEIAIAKKKTPPDPKELERLDKELAALQVKASGPAIDVIKQSIEAKKKEYEKASKYRKSQLEDEIKALEDQLELAQKRSAGMKDVIRPVASLVSKETGSTYPLLLQMGTMDAKSRKFAYGLSDVTSRDGKVYLGEGETQQEAAWNAVRDFAGHNEYGRGTIALAMPEGSAFQFPQAFIENTPHGTEIAKKRINDLVTILAILGLLIPGVGEVALVLGAAAAAAHLVERWQNGTLRADESAISDLIGVLGAVFAGAAAIGSLRVVRTSESFLLRTAESISKAAEVGNKALNYGGIIWGSLIDLNDVMADNDREMLGQITHAEARRNRATKLASAIQNGAMVIAMVKGEAEAHEGKGKAAPGEEGKPGEKKTTTPGDEGKPGQGAGEKPVPEKRVQPADQAERPASEGKNHEAKGDPAHEAGTPREPVNPKGEKPQARVTTADGLHQLFVLEDGRIIRCSISCGELRGHYEEFLKSAKNDPDPKRQKQAQDLDARLKKAEEGAKASKKEDRQAAAADAAALEPELRRLAASDLAVETGVKVADMEKMSANFTPDEIRNLQQTLGPKAFEKLAKGQKVQQQLSHALAAAGADPVMRGAMVDMVKNGLGKMSANELAGALSDLGKLQSHVPGYVTPDFVAEYQRALEKGDVAGAKKLLKAAEPGFREAQKKNQKEAMAKELAPLEAKHQEQQTEQNRLRAEEHRLEKEITKEAAAMKEAADRALKTKGEASDQARKEALAAKERMEAAKAELEKLPSASEAAKETSRTRQAMDDVRLRMDPESRAPLPCFSAGTLVWTTQGLRRIEEVQVDDPVMAFDFASSRLVERRIRRVFRNKTDHFYQIRADDTVIQATGRHRFWVEGLNRWVAAADLEPGMRLHVREDGIAEVAEVSLRQDFGVADTFNLSVEGNPNYFVGCGVLVHNAGGFDTKLGGDITIYRGVNAKYPDQVYIGKTIDESAGGKARGVKERQGEHQAYARKKLANKGSLSPDDVKFYEFMAEVQLTELVTGLTTVEQGKYLEQKNIEIEEGLKGKDNVMNRREEISSPEHLKKVAESIKNDPAVQAAGFCKR